MTSEEIEAGIKKLINFGDISVLPKPVPDTKSYDGKSIPKDRDVDDVSGLMPQEQGKAKRSRKKNNDQRNNNNNSELTKGGKSQKKQQELSPTQESVEQKFSQLRIQGVDGKGNEETSVHVRERSEDGLPSQGSQKKKEKKSSKKKQETVRDGTEACEQNSSRHKLYSQDEGGFKICTCSE